MAHSEMLLGKVSRMRFEPLGSAGTGIELTVVDAADRLGRWEVWLDDPQQIEAAFYHLSIAARKRGARVAELLRPASACPMNGITVCVG